MMSKTFRTLALILTLTCSAYAGDIQNGKTETPPPPTPMPTSTQETSVVATDGNMDNGRPEVIIQATLSLLQSVLSLF